MAPVFAPQLSSKNAAPLLKMLCNAIEHLMAWCVTSMECGRAPRSTEHSRALPHRRLLSVLVALILVSVVLALPLQASVGFSSVLPLQTEQTVTVTCTCRCGCIIETNPNEVVCEPCVPSPMEQLRQWWHDFWSWLQSLWRTLVGQ
jgi:hypothetical protein